MRHRKKGRKLSRKKNQRKALLKSLLYNFVKHGKIRLTEAKAKEIKPKIEKIITKAKTARLTDRRLITAALAKDAAKKLVEEIAPKYKNRNGGYTRIIKLGKRKSDASRMAIIEFV